MICKSLGSGISVCWLELFDTVNASAWKRDLKEWVDQLYGNLRERTCMVCSKPFAMFDLHHGIVSKQDVRGWPRKRRLLIDTGLNVVPLHHTCHMDRPPTREAVWAVQVGFYGKDIVGAWYDALPWKTLRPPRIF